MVKQRAWFQRFKSGNFDVEDKERAGRPKLVEDAEMEALLDKNPCQTQEKFAESLGITQSTISMRLNDPCIANDSKARKLCTI